MEEEYVDAQDSAMNEAVNRANDGGDNIGDGSKDFGDMNYDDGYEDDDGGNGFRGGRGRGNFRGRGRGPPPGWMNGPPPMRFRGRGYGPGGPPMRGRGFFRGRPRYNNFDNNWGPMGPPPPMMGGPPPFGPPHGMMGPGPMGPPPNMMGQPPFGPPPNMPPPNMPTPDLWVETKSEEGKSYYYHARTRETTWTRPQESPTCKVITQGEMEAMAAAGQMPPGGLPNPGMGMSGPMPGMGGPMPGGPMPGGPMPGGPMPGGPMPGGPMPGGPMPGGPAIGMQPPGAMPPFMTPPPWLKDGGKQENKPEARSPSENDDSPPGERSPALQPPNGNMNFPPASGAPTAFPTGAPPFQAGAPPQAFAPPQGFPNNPPPGFNNPPFANPGGPAPGAPGAPGPTAPPGAPPPAGGYPAWGGWGGWPPPLVAQPPPNLASVPHAGAATAVPGTAEPVEQPPPVTAPPKKEETVIPPALAAAAAEWSAHRAPDGRPYYYNAGKGESVWEKPRPMRELEELQAKIAEEKGEKPEKDKMDIDGKVEVPVIDVEAHAEAAAAAEAEKVRQHEAEQAAREQAERDKAEQEKREREDKEKEKAKRKNKPISIMPISGTPWCLVWSGDGRVFFYNPTAHTSFWERPEQLSGRADVDRAMACPPAAVTQYFQRKEASSTPTATKPTNGELKRAADSSSDESDPEPAKKAKPEEVSTAAAKKTPITSSLIDAGKEARIEAEARAARQRALVPLDQRIRVFRQMLQERDVSAFSTWEKELKKIVCDCRYLLLTSEERKQVYNKYVRERAEEERKEKKNKLQQKKNAFKQLMEEAKLHSKSSFNDFSTKYGRDERFKGIDKPRDRVTYFNEHIADVRKREKEDKERKREQAKTDFIALLKEKSIDRHARWADAKKKVDGEARYKAVESSTLREDYFREYCKIVKEERKKDKDKEKEKERDRSSSKKEKKDKERDKDKEKEKDKDEKREKDGKKDKKKDKGSEPEAATGSEAEAEPEAEAEAESSDAESEAARERAARAQASIKEREREVQRALATSLRDRDKEREYHKRDEAVQHFNALLADLVRNPDLAWREAKKQLKKDHRYTAADLLTKEDKERLFASHTSTLATRRRDKLRALLTDMGVAPTAHWRDVRARLRAEPAAPVYTSADKMEREFRDFQRDRQSAAKTALRQLLQETRSITHKTLASVKESEQMQPVHDMLKHDARYLALDHIPEERATIIQHYVEELAHKGPPPPPTATEPCRRKQ